MRRLPFKWKLFYWANVLITILILTLVIFIALYVVRRSQRLDRDDFMYLAFTLLTLAIIISNSLLNLHIIRKFYPSSPLPGKVDKRSTGFFFANIILWFLITLLLGVMIRDYFREDIQRTGGELLVILLAGFILGMQIFILVMQIKLPGIIQLNHKNEIRMMIDEIGDHKNA